MAILQIKGPDNSWIFVEDPTALRSTPQELTEIEKQQIKQNIGISDLMYVGDTQPPADACVGAFWLDTSENSTSVELINFTIRRNGYHYELNYKAEKGMTFRQWVDSEYNTDDWRCFLEFEDTPEGDHTFGITSDTYGTYVTGETEYDDVNMLDCDSIIKDNAVYYSTGTP